MCTYLFPPVFHDYSLHNFPQFSHKFSVISLIVPNHIICSSTFLSLWHVSHGDCSSSTTIARELTCSSTHSPRHKMSPCLSRTFRSFCSLTHELQTNLFPWKTCVCGQDTSSCAFHDLLKSQKAYMRERDREKTWTIYKFKRRGSNVWKREVCMKNYNKSESRRLNVSNCTPRYYAINLENAIRPVLGLERHFLPTFLFPILKITQYCLSMKKCEWYNNSV